MSAALTVATTLGNVVERIGAYGGLASIIGLGVLSLLYFAQAREVKRLREWAGRAPERASEIEQRVQTDAQRRVIAQPQTPAGVARVGNELPPNLPSPTAGLTGEAATRAAAAAIVAARATHPPAVGPPGQLARPAVPPAGTPGSPAPAPTAAGAVPSVPVTPPAPGSVPQAPNPAIPTVNRLPPTPTPAAPSKPAAPTSSVAAMASTPPSATVPTPPAPPAGAKPRVVAQPAPVGNGNVGQETRESAAARPEPPLTPPPPRTPPTSGGTQRSDDDEGTSPYRIAGIIGGGVLAVLIVGVIVLLMNGGDDTATKKQNTLGTAPSQQAPSKNTSNSSPPAAVDRGATPTTVLNGTTTAGLARRVADKLKSSGFKISDVKDFVDQTLPQTVVYYSDGNKKAAEAVAKVIGVSSSAVQPVDRNIDVASPGALVVVTVGADLVG